MTFYLLTGLLVYGATLWLSWNKGVPITEFDLVVAPLVVLTWPVQVVWLCLMFSRF